MTKKSKKVKERTTVRNCVLLLPKVDPIIIEGLLRMMPPCEFLKPF